ncbi:hypothetical protein [Leptospira noguchii]|uniref:Uncharacterized protein n=1 Tax=Leptospira noguchii serovar Panama str. CZ214 TaxID=1001595 RepID=T0FJ69_9LEPT|nr:hypothetical protein [Leptospira noguchii]EQA69645.1 hypothetical protein LEP1GSC059_2314 [Leptospira noguchii serovar Panama str. CZ214]
MIDYNQAKRLLTQVGVKSAPGTKYKVRFEDIKSGNYFFSQKLAIPKELPAGKTYKAIVLEIVGENPEKEVSSFDFLIPGREVPPPLPEKEEISPVGSTDLNLKLLLQLREQDRISHENERLLWENKLDHQKLFYENELRRKDEAHIVEIKRILADCESKIDLIRNNHIALESERLKMRSTIEKTVRAELKVPAQESMDINSLLSNPIVYGLASSFAKTKGIDLPALPNVSGLDLNSLLQGLQGVMGAEVGKSTGGLLELLKK